MLCGNHIRLALLVGLLSACKSRIPTDAESRGVKTVLTAEEAQSISMEEDAILNKRDTITNMRLALYDKRAALTEERKRLRNEGGDTSALDDLARDLLKEERSLSQQERDLNQQLVTFSRERKQIMTAISNSGNADIVGREAGLAAREKDLARREQSVANREEALAKREETLAEKWKDSCTTSVPQTIIRTVDAPGAKYTRKDVAPLLTRSRRSMSAKGLLASDLPPLAQGLEREATSAMRKGDFSRAHFAASQLYNTIRTMKIDKAFVSAKIERLNQVMKGKRLKASVRKKSDVLFREATALYGDAKFDRANTKLNEIYSAIR